MITEKPISIPTATMAASHLLFFPFSSLFTFRSLLLLLLLLFFMSDLPPTTSSSSSSSMPCLTLHSSFYNFFSFSLLKSQSYGKPPGTKLPFKQMTFN
jgi:hypothetical protein